MPSGASSKPDPAHTHSAAVALVRGFTKRCPRCGQGKLFRAWFRMAPRCPRCNLRFLSDEGAPLGSAMVNYSAVTIALVAYLIGGIVGTLPDPPMWPLIGGAVAVVLVVSVVSFPFSKTVWSAIELILHGFDMDSGPRDRRPG